MIERLGAGKPAEITFTCDFHELVGGDLRPGASVLLRYDPLRIVPPGSRIASAIPTGRWSPICVFTKAPRS